MICLSANRGLQQGRAPARPPPPQRSPEAILSRLFKLWGFDHNFANYNFKNPLHFNHNIEFHPSGDILLFESIVGEFVTKSPYEVLIL